MNLSSESKMLIFELGVAIHQKPGRRYVRASNLTRQYSPDAYRCRDSLPDGTISHHELIVGGMSGDEIGLTENGWRVFSGLHSEYCAGCPDWFRENMRKDPRSEVFAP